MSVSRMEKLTVIAPEERTDALLARLSRLRCIDLLDTPCDTDKLHPTDAAAACEAARAEAERIDAVLPALAVHDTRKKRLCPRRLRVKHEDFRTDGRMDVALKVVEETQKLLETKRALIEARDAALAAMASYTPYLSFNRNLNFSGTATTEALLGALPARTTHARLLEALADRAAVAEIVSEDHTGMYVCVLVHQSEKEETLRALVEIGFARASFADDQGSARQLRERANKTRGELESKLARVERRIASLAERILEVEILSDIAHTNLLVSEWRARTASTKRCTVLTAWCPTDRKEAVAAVLDRTEVAYGFEAATKEDTPPVLLRQHRFVRPFRRMLGMHAYPVYGGFDPTLLMSVLYCLVFGLMLADVGYGVLLAAASFLLLRFCRMPRFLSHAMWVLGCGSLFGILFGVLVGAYFGPLPALLAEEAVSLALLPQGAVRVIVAFNPLVSPVTALGAVYLLGAAHLLLAMLIRAIAMLRAKQGVQMLLSLLPHLVLLCGLVALPFSWLIGVIEVGCGVIAVAVIGAIRSEKGFKSRLLSALKGFVPAAHYAGMFLTYTRMLPLAIAGAALGFLLGGAAAVPFMGLLLTVAAFAISYLMCVGVDMLLAAAHAKGLPFVDFLGRFHERANPAFAPMAPSGRYAEDVSPAESI